MANEIDIILRIQMAKILIIDDDDAIRGVLEQMLAMSGHAVTVAADGFEGMQLYRADTPDLVIMDMLMPHSGLAAIRVLRSQFPDVRVIAMSGGGSRKLGYARELGACCTLTKPFSPQQLADAVAEALAYSPEKRVSSNSPFKPQGASGA